MFVPQIEQRCTDINGGLDALVVDDETHVSLRAAASVNAARGLRLRFFSPHGGAKTHSQQDQQSIDIEQGVEKRRASPHQRDERSRCEKSGFAKSPIYRQCQCLMKQMTIRYDLSQNMERPA